MVTRVDTCKLTTMLQSILPLACVFRYSVIKEINSRFKLSSHLNSGEGVASDNEGPGCPGEAFDAAAFFLFSS